MTPLVLSLFFITLLFNFSHTLCHVAFYYGAKGDRCWQIDALLGYGGALAYFVFVYVERDTLPLGLPFVVLGFVLFLLGLYIHGRAQYDFHFHSEEDIITSGIYRWFKHPMYLGWDLVVIGLPLMASALVPLMTAWIWILLIHICGYLEEKELIEKYGSTYLEYASRKIV